MKSRVGCGVGYLAESVIDARQLSPLLTGNQSQCSGEPGKHRLRVKSGKREQNYKQNDLQIECF